MLIIQSLLILLLSYVLQIQADSLGWEIGLVLPCLVALSAFLVFERYLILVLLSLFLTRWSPEIFNVDFWLWIGICLLIYVLRQILPLRSWTSVLILAVFTSGFWGWYYGSAWPIRDLLAYSAVSSSWSLLIFIIFRKLLKNETSPRVKLRFGSLP